jgi:hypothetical protein
MTANSVFIANGSKKMKRKIRLENALQNWTKGVMFVVVEGP